MSSSSPCPLKAFTHHRINRALPGVYPLVGSMRSSDGEKNQPWPFPVTNKMSVSSQRPVHLASAQLSVSSKGGRHLIFVRLLAIISGRLQGFSMCSFFPLAERQVFASSRRSPSHLTLSSNLTESRCSSRQRAVLATRSARRGACDLSSISFARSGLRRRQSRACQRTLQGREQNRCVLRPGLKGLLHSKQGSSVSMIGLWTERLTLYNRNLCQEAVA